MNINLLMHYLKLLAHSLNLLTIIIYLFTIKPQLLPPYSTAYL